jgi:hypothetical protein
MKIKNIMVIALALLITIILSGCQSLEEEIIEAEKELANMKKSEMQTYENGYKYNSELTVEEFDKKNNVLNIYILNNENYKTFFKSYKPEGKKYKGIEMSKRTSYLKMENDGMLEEIDSEEFFKNFSNDSDFKKSFTENKKLFQKINTIDYKVPTLNELEKEKDVKLNENIIVGLIFLFLLILFIFVLKKKNVI